MKKQTDQAEDLFELSPEQKKAFMALKRAVARCRKENVFLINYYGDIIALDGNKFHCEVISPSEAVSKDISLNDMPMKYSFHDSSLVSCADDEFFVSPKDD